MVLPGCAVGASASPPGQLPFVQGVERGQGFSRPQVTGDSFTLTESAQTILLVLGPSKTLSHRSTLFRLVVRTQPSLCFPHRSRGLYIPQELLSRKAFEWMGLSARCLHRSAETGRSYPEPSDAIPGWLCPVHAAPSLKSPDATCTRPGPFRWTLSGANPLVVRVHRASNFIGFYHVA